MEQKQTSIAKNTTWLTGAYIFQKIFAFVYFTLIARWLGANDIGVYTFAVSLATIMSIFIDLGLTSVLIRESSKYREKSNDYLNNIVTIKLLFSALTFIALVIIINLLDKQPIAQTMVYIAGLVMILDSFTLSFWGVFRAYQTLKYEAISIIFNQIFIFVVGIVGVWLKWPLWILIIALLAGSAFSFIYSLILIKIKLNFNFKLVWDNKTLKTLLKIAIPFALAGIFTRGYSYIDQILLSVLISDQSLGWYSVAYKMTYAFQFFPAAFAAAIFPAMSNLYLCDKEKLKMVFEKSMYFLVILALPITLGIYSIADKIIFFLYTSEYNPSILTLQIFIFAVLSLFLNYPVGSILNACDKQNINTMNMGITLVVNIVLNLILIPQYQHVGAALAALISLSLLFILNLFWVPTIIKYNWRYLLANFIKALIASLIMLALIIYLKATLNFILLIIIGAIVYILIMYLIKGFDKNELKYLWQTIIKKNI